MKYKRDINNKIIVWIIAVCLEITCFSAQGISLSFLAPPSSVHNAILHRTESFSPDAVNLGQSLINKNLFYQAQLVLEKYLNENSTDEKARTLHAYAVEQHQINIRKLTEHDHSVRDSYTLCLSIIADLIIGKDDDVIQRKELLEQAVQHILHVRSSAPENIFLVMDTIGEVLDFDNDEAGQIYYNCACLKLLAILAKKPIHGYKEGADIPLFIIQRALHYLKYPDDQFQPIVQKIGAAFFEAINKTAYTLLPLRRKDRNEAQKGDPSLIYKLYENMTAEWQESVWAILKEKNIVTNKGTVDNIINLDRVTLLLFKESDSWPKFRSLYTMLFKREIKNIRLKPEGQSGVHHILCELGIISYQYWIAYRKQQRDRSGASSKIKMVHAKRVIDAERDAYITRGVVLFDRNTTRIDKLKNMITYLQVKCSKIEAEIIRLTSQQHQLEEADQPRGAGEQDPQAEKRQQSIKEKISFCGHDLSSQKDQLTNYKRQLSAFHTHADQTVKAIIEHNNAYTDNPVSVFIDHEVSPLVIEALSSKEASHQRLARKLTAIIQSKDCAKAWAQYTQALLEEKLAAGFPVSLAELVLASHDDLTAVDILYALKKHSLHFKTIGVDQIRAQQEIDSLDGNGSSINFTEFSKRSLFYAGEINADALKKFLKKNTTGNKKYLLTICRKKRVIKGDDIDTITDEGAVLVFNHMLTSEDLCFRLAINAGKLPEAIRALYNQARAIPDMNTVVELNMELSDLIRLNHRLLKLAYGNIICLKKTDAQKRYTNPLIEDADCLEDGTYYNQALYGDRDGDDSFDGIIPIFTAHIMQHEVQGELEAKDIEIHVLDISPDIRITTKIIHNEKRAHIVINKAYVRMTAFQLKRRYQEIELPDSRNKGTKLKLISTQTSAIARQAVKACIKDPVTGQIVRQTTRGPLSNIAALIYYWSFALENFSIRSVKRFLEDNPGIKEGNLAKILRSIEAIENARCAGGISRPMKYIAVPIKHLDTYPDSLRAYLEKHTHYYEDSDVYTALLFNEFPADRAEITSQPIPGPVKEALVAAASL
ncbi:MAG: hypothetical protein ABII23_04150 [bacterium]